MYSGQAVLHLPMHRLVSVSPVSTRRKDGSTACQFIFSDFEVWAPPSPQAYAHTYTHTHGTLKNGFAFDLLRPSCTVDSYPSILRLYGLLPLLDFLALLILIYYYTLDMNISVVSLGGCSLLIYDCTAALDELVVMMHHALSSRHTEGAVLLLSAEYIDLY